MNTRGHGYEVESTPWSSGRSRKSAQGGSPQSVVQRWVVKMPVIVTVLAAVGLGYLCYGDPGGEYFLPPEIFMVAGCFVVYLSSFVIGVVLAIVNHLLRRRSEH